MDTPRAASRRRLLASATLLAGIAPLALRYPAAARDATPEPADELLLFVQVAESGAAEPVEGEAGRYRVTLANGSGETLYFSDRPERLAGILGTGTFLRETGAVAGLPNAALTLRPDDRALAVKVAVLELIAGAFDPESSIITYDVQLLDVSADSALAPDDPALSLDSLPAAFGQATLFIDPYVRPYHSGSLKPVNPDIVITRNR